ncbi:MAG: adenylate kinase family protein [Candidatus Woesearchaeota archaeon]|nr:MAG: adenylate kinase family protein [Candidatus Woesearchaeota archaeon]
MKVIIITGSVGTGKTTIAKKLAKRLKFKYLDVNKLISKYKLAEGYDRKRKTKIVDEEKLSKKLMQIIKSSKNSLVIDSHLSHFLPKEYVDLCIVTKCNIKTLKKRLKKRKYSEEKIQENLQAEIFDIILIEAKENNHNIYVIETDKRYNLNKIKTEITL